MSTKIYYGKRFNPTPKNLKEVRDIIFKFKKQAMEHYKTKYYKLIMAGITDIFDSAALYGKVDYKFPKRNSLDVDHLETIFEQSKEHSIWWTVEQAIARKADIYKNSMNRGHLFSQYDFYCNLTILPCNNEIFLMLFSEDRHVQKLLDAVDEIEEYPYWNNTDQPDEITEEEWDERGDQWEEALGESGVPSENGFGIDIINKCSMLFIEDGKGLFSKLLEHTIDFYTRVEYYVDAALRRIYDTENKVSNIKLIENCQFKQLNEKYKIFLQEHLNLAETKRKEIVGKLKREFTQDDLQMPIKDFIVRFELQNDPE